MNTQLDKTHFFPCVVQAVPTDNFEVYAYMNDGTVRKVDIKPLIKPDTVFAPMADIEFFKDRLTVIGETVAWDISGDRNEYECVDIDVETIFDSPPVADPLEI